MPTSLDKPVAPTPAHDDDESGSETESHTDVSTKKPDERMTIQVNGIVDDNFWMVTGTKGKGAGVVTIYNRPPLNVPNPFVNIIKMVGVENWIRTIIEDVLNPACKNATKAAFDAATGKYSLTKYAQAFVDYFLSETRGGAGVRELTKRFRVLSAQVTPYIQSQINPDESQVWSEEETAHWKVLLLEWAQINAKLSEQGAPKARGKRAVKSSATAEAATTEA